MKMPTKFKRNKKRYLNVLFKTILSKPKYYIWNAPELLNSVNNKLPSMYKLSPKHLALLFHRQRKFQIFRRSTLNSMNYIFVRVRE